MSVRFSPSCFVARALEVDLILYVLLCIFGAFVTDFEFVWIDSVVLPHLLHFTIIFMLFIHFISTDSYVESES